MVNILQKKKAADLLHRIGGSSDFDFSVVKGVLTEVESLEKKIPHIDLSPLYNAVKRLDDILNARTLAISSLSESVEKLKQSIDESIQSTQKKIKKEGKDELDHAIQKLEGELKEVRGDILRFPQGGGGSRIQILNNGSVTSTKFIDLNLIPAGGMTFTTSEDATNRRVNFTMTAAASSTAYTETPSGLINGSNVTYTVLHTINTVYNFAINGQFIHPSEYTASGTTITFNTPLDVSLSGTSFTIVYS